MITNGRRTAISPARIAQEQFFYDWHKRVSDLLMDSHD